MKFTKIFFTLMAAVLALANGAAAHLPKSYEGLTYLGGGVGVHAGETSTYYASIHKARWSVAEEECQQMTGGEGDLVAIESAEEDLTLHNLIRSSDVALQGQNLWTSGAYDSIARVWRWSSTGEPFEYTNWEGGEAPVFAPSTARVAFRSLDRFNYNWQMRADSEELNYYICEVPAYRNDTPVPCKRENNLVIVLDGSGSIAAPDFVLGKHFSALLAGAFDSPSRVSYIVYSSSSQVIFDLDNGLSGTQINDTIRAAAQPAGSTATNLAIDQAVAMLVLKPTDIPRKLVVLTDGQSDDPVSTAAAAARAAAAGIRSFSVGIGSGIGQAELLAIAGGDPDNVYTVATFDELIQVIAPVCVRVCAPWTPPNP